MRWYFNLKKEFILKKYEKSRNIQKFYNLFMWTKTDLRCIPVNNFIDNINIGTPKPYNLSSFNRSEFAVNRNIYANKCVMNIRSSLTWSNHLRINNPFDCSTSTTNMILKSQRVLTSPSCKSIYVSSRLYSTQNEDQSTKSETKMLMQFPLIVWPTVFQTIRNWLFVLFIIKPYYEADFTLKSFCIASKQALNKVSELLTNGKFTELEEFVESRALQEVKNNFSLLNFKERLDLTTNIEDIFFCFPYQVGLIFNKEDASNERTFLEITMCYHIFRGFKDFVDKANDADLQALYDKSDRISVANYRFIKEITKGAEDQWTINILNHFKPVKLAARF